MMIIMMVIIGKKKDILCDDTLSEKVVGWLCVAEQARVTFVWFGLFCCMFVPHSIDVETASSGWLIPSMYSSCTG